MLKTIFKYYFQAQGIENVAHLNPTGQCLDSPLRSRQPLERSLSLPSGFAGKLFAAHATHIVIIEKQRLAETAAEAHPNSPTLVAVAGPFPCLLPYALSRAAGAWHAQ